MANNTLTPEQIEIVKELSTRSDLSDKQKAIVSELNSRISPPKSGLLNDISKSWQVAQRMYGDTVPGITANALNQIREGVNVPIPMTNKRLNIPGTAAAGKFVSEQMQREGAPQWLSKLHGGAVEYAPDITAMVATPTESIGKVSALKAPAEGMARRFLGFSKSMLKNDPRLKQAEEAAKVALEQGIVPKSGSVMAGMERAQALNQKTGSAIGEFLSNVGEKFKPDRAVEEINSLRPRSDTGKVLYGGEYQKINNTIDNALATINAHAEEVKKLVQDSKGLLSLEVKKKLGNLKFETANKIKGLLQKMANYGESEDPEKAKAIASTWKNNIDNLLEKVSKETGNSKEFGVFLKNKKLYGASEKMIEGLDDAVAKSKGNMAISFPSLVLAASRPDAMGTIARGLLAEFTKRRGAGISANALYGGYKYGARALNPLMSALMSNKKKEQ